MAITNNMDVSTTNLIHPEPQTKPFYRSPVTVAIIYIVAIGLAEILTTYIHPAIGMIAHSVTMIALLLHIAIVWDEPLHQMLLGLMFAPLIRLLSLALPLNDFAQIYWYFIVSVPLFVTAFVIMRIMGFSASYIGFSLKKLPLQILIACTGFLFGFIEYSILRPQPLIKNLNLEDILIPALILFFSTGLMEELLFRGIMQRASESVLRRGGNILFATAIFMVLHIGYKSLFDLIFVFAVGFFWAWVVAKTHSIIGTTVSHGITNILLFLVCPFIFANGTALNVSTDTALYTLFQPVKAFQVYLAPLVILIYISSVMFLFVGKFRQPPKVKRLSDERKSSEL